MDKFCAIIVTFNRKELLLENLKMIFSQRITPEHIYIIDNHGSDNTLDYLINSNIDMNKIKYSYLENNIEQAVFALA